MSVPIIAFLVEDDDSGLHLEYDVEQPILQDLLGRIGGNVNGLQQYVKDEEYDEEEGSQWRWQWIIGGTLTAPFPVTAPTLFRVADWDHTVDETLLSEELAQGTLLLPPVSCLKHELLPVGVNYGAMGVAGDNVFSYRQIVNDKIHYDGKEIHISLASNPPETSTVSCISIMWRMIGRWTKDQIRRGRERMQGGAVR